MPRWTNDTARKPTKSAPAKTLTRQPRRPSAPRKSAGRKPTFTPPVLLQVGDCWLNPADVIAIGTQDATNCIVFTKIMRLEVDVSPAMAANAILTNTPCESMSQPGEEKDTSINTEPETTEVMARAIYDPDAAFRRQAAD